MFILFFIYHSNKRVEYYKTAKFKHLIKHNVIVSINFEKLNAFKFP